MYGQEATQKQNHQQFKNIQKYVVMKLIWCCFEGTR